MPFLIMKNMEHASPWVPFIALVFVIIGIVLHAQLTRKD